jgi:hypothetical protein
MQFPIRPLLPKDYPPLLRQIPDMPEMLYIRGQMPPPDYTYYVHSGFEAYNDLRTAHFA